MSKATSALASQLETEKRQIEMLMAKTEAMRANPGDSPSFNMTKIKQQMPKSTPNKTIEPEPTFWNKVANLFKGPVCSKAVPSLLPKLVIHIQREPQSDNEIRLGKV